MFCSYQNSYKVIIAIFHAWNDICLKYLFLFSFFQKQAGNPDADRLAELQQQHALHRLQQTLQVRHNIHHHLCSIFLLFLTVDVRHEKDPVETFSPLYNVIISLQCTQGWF